MGRLALLGLLLLACREEPEVRTPGEWTEAELRQLARLRLDVTPPPSPGNRWADDPDAAALGQALFHDPGLSRTGAVSCATCHQPHRHFTDGLEKGVGIGVADRNTPTVVGSQWGNWFFWDGRADSLWAQALGPIENPVEMGFDRVGALRHAAKRYEQPYEEIFGPLPELEGLPEAARPGATGADAPHARAWEALSSERQHEVNTAFANLGKAMEAYQRLLVPGEAPFDRYVDAVLAGDAEGGGHLEEAQVRGLGLFIGEANCVLCHDGPMFTDRAFHNLGIPKERGYDPGRMRGALQVLGSPFRCGGAYADTDDCPELRYLDPGFDDFISAFKTPTLRNVTETAPYMHDGSMPTLESVLDFYATLPGEPAAGHRELTLQPLDLSEAELADLEAFLDALTGAAIPEALAGPPPAADQDDAVGDGEAP